MIRSVVLSLSVLLVFAFAAHSQGPTVGDLPAMSIAWDGTGGGPSGECVPGVTSCLSAVPRFWLKNTDGGLQNSLWTISSTDWSAHYEGSDASSPGDASWGPGRDANLQCTDATVGAGTQLMFGGELEAGVLTVTCRVYWTIGFNYLSPPIPKDYTITVQVAPPSTVISAGNYSSYDPSSQYAYGNCVSAFSGGGVPPVLVNSGPMPQGGDGVAWVDRVWVNDQLQPDCSSVSWEGPYMTQSVIVDTSGWQGLKPSFLVPALTLKYTYRLCWWQRANYNAANGTWVRVFSPNIPANAYFSVTVSVYKNADGSANFSTTGSVPPN